MKKLIFVLSLLALALPTLAQQPRVAGREVMQAENGKGTNTSAYGTLRIPDIGLDGQNLVRRDGSVSNSVSAPGFPFDASLGPRFFERRYPTTNFNDMAEASINQDTNGEMVVHFNRINNEGKIWETHASGPAYTNWSVPVIAGPGSTNRFFNFITRNKNDGLWYMLCGTNLITVNGNLTASNIYIFRGFTRLGPWVQTNSGNPVFTRSATSYREQLYNPGIAFTTNDQCLLTIETKTNAVTCMFATNSAFSAPLAAGTLNMAWATLPTFGAVAAGEKGFVFNPCPVYVTEENSYLLFAAGWFPNTYASLDFSVAKPLSITSNLALGLSWLVASNTFQHNTVFASNALDTYAATDIHIVGGVTNSDYAMHGIFLVNQTNKAVNLYANYALQDFFKTAFVTNQTKVANLDVAFGNLTVPNGTVTALGGTFFSGTANAPDPAPFTVLGPTDATRGVIKLGGWSLWSRGTLDAPNQRYAIFDPLGNEAFTLLNGGNAYFNGYLRDITLRGANTVTTIEAADGVDIAEFGFNNYQVKFHQIGQDVLVYLDGSDVLSPVTIGANMAFVGGVLSATGGGTIGSTNTALYGDVTIFTDEATGATNSPSLLLNVAHGDFNTSVGATVGGAFWSIYMTSNLFQIHPKFSSEPEFFSYARNNDIAQFTNLVRFSVSAPTSEFRGEVKATAFIADGSATDGFLALSNLTGSYFGITTTNAPRNHTNVFEMWTDKLTAGSVMRAVGTNGGRILIRPSLVTIDGNDAMNVPGVLGAGSVIASTVESSEDTTVGGDLHVTGSATIGGYPVIARSITNIAYASDITIYAAHDVAASQTNHATGNGNILLTNMQAGRSGHYSIISDASARTFSVFAAIPIFMLSTNETVNSTQLVTTASKRMLVNWSCDTSTNGGLGLYVWAKSQP